MENESDISQDENVKKVYSTITRKTQALRKK